MTEEIKKNSDAVQEIKPLEVAPVVVVSAPKDDLLPDEIDSVPLEKSAVMLVNNIIKTDDIDELKRYTKLYEINQAKKNALRVIKLNSLLDKVNDLAIERIDKRPYEVSNKELLDYMQVVSTQIEKSHDSIEKIGDSPMIQFNQQNNSINVNVGNEAADRESKERVIDAVTALLKVVRGPVAMKDAVIIDTTKDVVINKNEKEGEKK